MIIFKELIWNNFFGYGSDNRIDFTAAPVVQLLGLNGVGKTSIPLILQETIFSKNVKKIIKSKLVNRYLTNVAAYSKLIMDIDGIEYVIEYSRKGTKLTIILTQDGVDISSHTAPNTIKTIESILNIDFETFCQLVYQSSKSSLQFLTATDTQRKKFLISLFNLEKYTKVHEIFKTAVAEVNKEIATINGRFSVYEDWIKNHAKVELKEPTLLEVPEEPKAVQDYLNTLEVDKLNIIGINKRINANNTYKKQLESIDKELLHTTPLSTEGLEKLKDEKISTSTLISEKQKFIKQIDGKSDICPTCKQTIDLSDSKKLADNYRSEIALLEKNLSDTIQQLEILEKNKKTNYTISKTVEQFENLTNLINDELAEDVMDVDNLQLQIKEASDKIQQVKKDIKLAKERNEYAVTEYNRTKSDNEQYKEYQDKLNECLNDMDVLFNNLSKLEVLRDAFGTNGLVSYKLEYLTKDLEMEINSYLVELSQGRFSLSFQLVGDKLNIEVFDDGESITINEVSEGQLSKINVSTLLAIRKLMQSLSNTKLNILFLDEIMGVLDSHGREELIVVLLKEESLNTFLVSHEYRHPLVPVLEVVQEDKISRIENG